MALMCVRHLGYRARLQYKALSPEVVRNALLRAQYGIVKYRRNAQRSALCDSDATVASGEETLLDDGGGAKLSSVRD